VRAQLERQNGLAYDRAEVIVSSGSTQAIAGALTATLEDGDEVIIPVPCWAPYIDQARLNGGRPIELACPHNNGFKLRPDELAAAITPRAHALAHFSTIRSIQPVRSTLSRSWRRSRAC
jgi:aspartate aminotransferase